MPEKSGGIIQSIEPGTLAESAGLQAGDKLLAINGHLLRDVIDVQFYAADETLDLLVERDGAQQRLRLERAYDQDLGLSFVNPTFDTDIRRCANNCGFCFVKQNPRGMRRSLYIKDDDYRYSFLFGNFVTLTNLTHDDWLRLEEQRLSPLYVSVHATEPGLRRRFLGRAQAPDILAQLHRLAGLGVEVHTQVVVVPGLNDGQHLDRTLSDLASLREKPVLSVGVVPIGLTKHHRGPCRTHTPDESRALLDRLETWQRKSRSRSGTGFVYPSDEWYLVAGRDVPLAEEYDGFPQLENGIGLVRQLLEEWQELRPALPGAPLTPATLVCGTLIAPVLAGIIEDLNERTGSELKLLPLVNQFFGPVTTVSGLLTGTDIVAALRGKPLGQIVILPRAMFTGRYGASPAHRGETLDGMTLAAISTQLGARVEMADTIHQALAALGERRHT
jgi:putative radical SAM enzyme (TIGR03279 family)